MGGKFHKNFNGELQGNFDGKFNGNLGQKFNRKLNMNFDGNGEMWRREMKPRRWKGVKGVRGRVDRNGEKGYKRGVIFFFLCTAGYPS